MTSRVPAALLALLSLTGPPLVPFTLASSGDRHGCTEEMCRCAHRPPAKPAVPATEAPCHGAAAVPDCAMSARCHHEQTAPLAASPVFEMARQAGAAPPYEGVQPFPPGDPVSVRHGFARLEPHPPPAL